LKCVPDIRKGVLTPSTSTKFLTPGFASDFFADEPSQQKTAKINSSNQVKYTYLLEGFLQWKQTPSLPSFLAKTHNLNH